MHSVQQVGIGQRTPVSRAAQSVIIVLIRKSLNVHISTGGRPVNKLSCKVNVSVYRARYVIMLDSGVEGAKPFSSVYKNKLHTNSPSSTKFPTSDGISPDSSFPCSRRLLSTVSKPISVGISPVRPLSLSSKVSIADKKEACC